MSASEAVDVSSLSVRARAAVGLARLAATASRRSGVGGGSMIGGRVGLRVEPRLLQLLAGGQRVALVTGTNGKTTTTRLVVAALSDRWSVASNVSGANMPSGLVSALLASAESELAVFEVDEGYLPHLMTATHPVTVSLLNLTRDQLDRMAESGMLAHRWRAALLATTNALVIANADDPLVVWAASAADRVIWVAAGQPWTDDSWYCPQCGGSLRRPGGGWHCTACEFRRPEPGWAVREEMLVAPGTTAVSDGKWSLRLGLPGRANRANAAIAVATAAVLGVDPSDSLGAMRPVSSVGGRYRRLERNGRTIRLLMAKNPAGWLETYEFLAPAPAAVVLSVNARSADGRDTSWLWDVSFAPLRGRPVYATGERAYDLAVRLDVADVDFTVVSSVSRAIDLAPPGEVDVVANYTAFQAMRARFDDAA